MSAADRLAEIEARYGDWYGGDDYMGPAAVWPDQDPGEPAERYITRNDVPVLVAALRAVLAVLDGAAKEYRATSDAMQTAVINREAHDFDADDITRYAAYAGAAEGAARRACEAIESALGGAS